MRVNILLIIKIVFWIWLAVLLFLTYFPQLPTAELEIGDEIFRLDYLGHLIFYFVLIVLFILSRLEILYNKFNKLLLFSLFAGIVFATLTELSQKYIPGRTYNIFDLVYNCMGVFLGLVFIYFGHRKNLFYFSVWRGWWFR